MKNYVRELGRRIRAGLEYFEKASEIDSKGVWTPNSPSPVSPDQVVVEAAPGASESVIGLPKSAPVIPHRRIPIRDLRNIVDDQTRDLIDRYAILNERITDAIGIAMEPKSVSPTRADLTLLWSEIDDLKARVRSVETIASSGEAVAHEAYGDAKDCLKANKRIDAAIQAIETAIQAHPTAPEVK
jgi:hypothetical protein